MDRAKALACTASVLVCLVGFGPLPVPAQTIPPASPTLQSAQSPIVAPTPSVQPALPPAADNNANTPLHVAASQGMTKMVALLLAQGANVNAKTNMKGFESETDDYVGDTPFHLALSERHWRAISHERQKQYASKGAGAAVETAAVLLANGADVNAKNDKGKTPLRLATSQEMRALLRKHGAK